MRGMNGARIAVGPHVTEVGGSDRKKGFATAFARERPGPLPWTYHRNPGWRSRSESRIPVANTSYDRPLATRDLSVIIIIPNISEPDAMDGPSACPTERPARGLARAATPLRPGLDRKSCGRAAIGLQLGCISGFFPSRDRGSDVKPLIFQRRWGAGVVERGGLENRCTLARTVGSNPTPTATT